MPDLHSPSDLDRAFETLASDLTARAGRPGPDAAMATARRRRRTTVAAGAAAAVLAVGAVLVPQVAPERLGLVADLPAPAPLDASAFEEATEGWISGWAAGDPVGDFRRSPCYAIQSGPPQENASGSSTFASSTHAGAVVQIWGYHDTGTARRGYDFWVSVLKLCRVATGGVVGDYPHGTEVSHYRVQAPGDRQDVPVTDVWVGTTGERSGMVYGMTDGGPAGDETVESVADALVAGLRSGWAQRPLGVPAALRELSPRLPAYDERDLAAALDGWGPVQSMDAFGTPTTPCLARMRGGTASLWGGDPTRAKIAMKGYDPEGGRAAEEAGHVIDRLAECRSVQVRAESLPGGVTLLTYDRGGDAGHGAVWVASTRDRAMLVRTDGAATAVPADAAEAAGEWVRQVLDQPSPADG